MRAPVPRSYRRTPPAGRLAALAALVGTCTIGCGDPPIVRREVEIALSDATSCRPPGGVERIRIRALGDAPDGLTLELDADQGARTVPDAPFPILALRAAAEGPGWSAIGYRTLADRGDSLLLLPPALSCGLADPEARASAGAAVSGMADGSLVIAGGLGDDGIATRRVVTLAPGAQTVEMAPVELASASAFASATGLDDGRVLIAGGAIAGDAPPYDTYEELDLADPDARIVGTLAERRRDHAAIALRDGRVLLVGGRRADGAALTSIELVDRSVRRGRAALASLALARVAPTLALDDHGRVWIAGGEAGAEVALERFDPVAERIERHDLALPRADALAFLPGGRLAWLAGDRAFVVLMRGGEGSAEVVAAEARAPIAIVPQARAIATPGGQALVVGRERALLFDPGRGTAHARGTSVAPLHLAVLGDRSVVELAPTGASLRREDEPTPHEAPAATLLFALDDAWVLLDPTDRSSDPAWLAPRLEQQGSELLVRVAGARADVRSLRASRMDVEVLGEGALDLVLMPDDGPEIVIALREGAIEVDGCTLAHTDGPIALDPQRVSVGTASCPIASTGPFGIAVRGREVGARLVGVSIARR